MVILLYFALGLGLLFMGMKFLTVGLENAAGEQFNKVLRKLTINPVMGLVTGTVITALIQSSTAITVFAIGLVNAGLMSFEQTLGIILGTNIGTTITAQLMAFQLENLAVPVIILGGLVFILGKKELRWIGLSVIGFGLVFLGISFVGNAFEPLGNSPRVMEFLKHLGDNHLLGIVVGAAIAGLVNCSGVTTGMVIALSTHNLITLPTAITVVLGANIGNSVTALLVSIGGNTGAKRVAVSHFLLNVFGVIAFYPVLNPYSMAVSRLSQNMGRQVAHAHSLFNIATSLAMLPFVKQFAKLIRFIVPDKKNK